MTTNWDPLADFYSFRNYGVFNDGGDCYGFASSSILYFRHYSLGDLSFPFFPSQGKHLSELSGQTGGNSLSQNTFPIYIHQTYDPNNQVLNPTDEQASVLALEKSIQSGLPVILALGPSEGHAVVASGYALTSNGSIIIDVSDPNFGNQARHASYHNGLFSYTGVAGGGSFTWNSFNVITPTTLQWNWLALRGILASQWSSTVNSTNPYYTYVFSSVPTKIVTSEGTSFFTNPGNTLTFNSTVQGVVGFEEDNIQVYGIPKGILFSIQDPGESSSMITVIIPRNESSIVGYQLTTSSQLPLNLTISPTESGVEMTTSSDIETTMVLFSINQSSHAALNASSISVRPSQTVSVSIPDWGHLNNTKSAPKLLIFGPNGSSPVASYNFTNWLQEPSTSAFPGHLVGWFVLAGGVAFVVAVILVAYKTGKVGRRPPVQS
ncbi:MAG: hypothetical protein HY247_05700 [archaeon]|nr:MAG: hypothetical protein HY247_05700 [archaeon]